jgi:hypothetical protein
MLGIGIRIFPNDNCRYLAMTGQTAVEFWMRKSQEDMIKNNSFDPEARVVDYRRKNRIDNLEYIFGTRSIWRMLLPSWRKLPNDGVDWENYINMDAEHNKVLLNRRKLNVD